MEDLASNSGRQQHHHNRSAHPTASHAPPGRHAAEPAQQSCSAFRCVDGQERGPLLCLVQRSTSLCSLFYWHSAQHLSWLRRGVRQSRRAFATAYRPAIKALSPISFVPKQKPHKGHIQVQDTVLAFARSGYRNYTEAICPPSLTHFDGFNKHWNMPSDISGGFKNMWYSYDVGMVHYVFYDTETDLGPGLIGPEDVGGSSDAHDGPLDPNSPSAQIDFLKKDLASVDRKKTPWVIAAGHRPWYMAAKAKDLCTVCQEAFEHILYDNGVDVIFNGHQHNSQRQTPLGPGAKIDPNGLNNPSSPMYILTGAAGHFDGLDSAHTPYPEYSKFVNDTLYGFSRVTFHNRTHMTHEFISSATNDVLDSATLYKQH